MSHLPSLRRLVAGRSTSRIAAEAGRTSRALVVVLAIALICLSAVAGPPAAATAPAAGTAAHAFTDLPLAFVENRGQADPQVRYHAQGADYSVSVTPEQVVLSFADDAVAEDRRSARAVTLALQFVGGDRQVQPQGRERTPMVANYLRGDDPTQWRTGLPSYSDVLYRDLWPGVDLLLRGERDALKYEFRLRPGASPDDVHLRYAGARGVSVDTSGALLVETAMGVLRDAPPVSYQVVDGVRVPVESRYVVHDPDDGSYGFEVGDHRADAELVIDPALDWSTLVGGSSMDRADAVAVDDEGRAVVVGSTQSSDFPTTPGAVDETFNDGVVDVFVAKLTADGSGLVYATYLGGVPTVLRKGTGDPLEFGRAVAVDGAGNAYVTGQTTSSDFPVTGGAFDTTLNASPDDATDAFVTKLGPTGDLLWSTFLGGTSREDPGAIALDASGNVHVAGGTLSSDFPTTAGSFDTASNGGEDVFVAKLDPAGASLVYSTLLGGADNELPGGLAVDASGSAHVTGSTRSAGFPTTAGALEATHNGGEFADLFDVFVTKLNADGTGLVWSTFLGGPRVDRAEGLALDAAGNSYVIGGTQSPDFPVTAGAFDTAFDGTSQSFLSKLDATGSALGWSTFLGLASAGAVTLDGDANPWFTGNAPAGAATTPDAFATASSGGNDAYIAQLQADGSALLYGTYLGGANSEHGTAVALDPLGSVYVSGTTYSPDFPTTAGAFDQVFDGDPSIFWGDGFVVKLTDGASAPPPVDGTAPVVEVSSPAAGSTVAGTVPFVAVASDDVGVSEVRFAVDGTQVGADSTAPYEVAWDSTGVANGSHVLTAAASDAAGNVGQSASVTVTVDNAAAVAVLSSLAVSPSSVAGGESSTGTVTLDGAAPAGGATVALASSGAAVTVPVSVTVAEGATGATFTATTGSVSADTSVTLSATLGATTRTASLTVLAPATAMDTVTITRAEYDGDKQVLRVEASSSTASATLTVHVTSTGELVGTLSSGRGEFSWPSNPGSITVRSSAGGSATATVSAD